MKEWAQMNGLVPEQLNTVQKLATELQPGDVFVGGGTVREVIHASISGCTCYGSGGVHIHSQDKPSVNGCYWPFTLVEVYVAPSLS